jgi:hypothetical protein
VSDDGPLVEESPQGDRLETTPPLLRVVRGDPTPEELAALVAVIASLGSPADGARRRTPEWSAPHRRMRVHYSHGPGGWRSSALPR